MFHRFIRVLLAVGGVLSITPTVQADSMINMDTVAKVAFIPSTEVVPPLNPNHPQLTDPLTPADDGPQFNSAGPLSLDFVSSFNFGKHPVTNQTVTYQALAQQDYTQDKKLITVPNYVQVTDNRGSDAGWALKVRQNGQFSNPTAQFKQLSGAEINLLNPELIGITDAMQPAAQSVQLNPDGTEAVVMAAAVGTGMGTWINRFGNQDQLITQPGKADAHVNQPTKIQEMLVNPAVTLTIPGTTPRDAKDYSTTLTWILTNTPIN
ncbi:MAG: WxL domain-containing protein [Lactobacillaceae bacterium]|jgi:hypothetical protein|nr:WxL domain-containing protein [Lactobacillaceae bacterium]